MPLAALALVLLTPFEPAPVPLARKFVANEKLAYAFHGHLTYEQRQEGLDTWIPSDTDVDYGFTLQVKGIKSEGFASVQFLLPAVTETAGETASSGPKASVEKVGWDLLYTISPANEVIEMLDRTPKKKKATANLVRRGGSPRASAQAGFGSFISEVHRLASFFGTLDIAPRFPLEPIAVGGTWQRTVGYQPQKLKGKDGKSAVQRLDYTYTYLGPMTSNGKPVLRVQGKLNLETDLGDFLRSMFARSPGADDPEIKDAIAKLKMPLTLKATIDFDLDPKTKATLSAQATSEGGFQYTAKEGSDAVFEERFKGRSTLDLVGRKIVAPTPPKKGRP